MDYEPTQQDEYECNAPSTSSEYTLQNEYDWDAPSTSSEYTLQNEHNWNDLSTSSEYTLQDGFDWDDPGTVPEFTQQDECSYWATLGTSSELPLPDESSVWATLSTDSMRTLPNESSSNEDTPGMSSGTAQQDDDASCTTAGVTEADPLLDAARTKLLKVQKALKEKADFKTFDYTNFRKATKSMASALSDLVAANALGRPALASRKDRPAMRQGMSKSQKQRYNECAKSWRTQSCDLFEVGANLYPDHLRAKMTRQLGKATKKNHYAADWPADTTQTKSIDGFDGWCEAYTYARVGAVGSGLPYDEPDPEFYKHWKGFLSCCSNKTNVVLHHNELVFFPVNVDFERSAGFHISGELGQNSGPAGPSQSQDSPSDSVTPK